MSDFARRMVGSDTMSEEQLRQIREQQEVIWEFGTDKLTILILQYLFYILDTLTHYILNELPNTIYWKILISILGMSGYVIKIF